MSTVYERSGVVTFRGRPMTLLGPEITVGMTAPDFTVLGADMSETTLASSARTTRLFASVPSIDTDVCDVETRRFDAEIARLGGVSALTVSADLPFAQRRWCSASGASTMQLGSDHRGLSFGLAYGVAVKELRLLARAVFVVDGTDTVIYAEYVPEIGAHPNYDAVLDAIGTALTASNIR